ncbi:MAG: UDP-2,4-diacetamido-2,4,6-trideoxy-beta-L-altropyranose hydrolase, partial [Proteobacteria bacterium]|nr:UDP-2,4-diacetamido-2,4,6-trideoxy-beta-L-altropyranose hydrolase [Pseudomonadota bacterium]
MKAFFRVDASLEIGTGHVMRCLTLAHTLQDYGIENEFLCRKLDGNLINKIQNEGFKVHELDNAHKNNGKDGLEHSHWLKTTQQNDAEDCIKIIESKGVDWLIVDHYALDSQWEIALKPFTKKMLVIDDLADRAHDCNILLDQNFSRTHQEYEPLVTKECRLLLGTKYALLRPEFLNFRGKSLKRRSKH